MPCAKPQFTDTQANTAVEPIIRKPYKWAYGVTTVPQRKANLLPRTLLSLANAGFESPRLFIDGLDYGAAQEWKDTFKLDLTIHDTSLRTHGNWVLALYELYIRNGDADRYAIFQDDLVTYKRLRQYLESCEYPENGYLNLYLFNSNQTLCPKFPNGDCKIGWYLSNQLGRGAVGLVFSRPAVKTLLSSSHLADRPQSMSRGWKAVDGGIVDSFKGAGWQEWVHYPSLVQHMGDVSVMGNMRHQQAPSFMGEEFDAFTLLQDKTV